MQKSVQKLIQSYMNFVRGGTGGGARFSPWMLLVPPSWIVRFWVGVLDFFYRHGLKQVHEPPIPVVSVGNITYGGTNKTPFVEMLCRAMRRKGISVGIVSRGYGGDTPDVRIIEAGNADRRAVGDEPLLLSTRLPDVPVAVSRERMRGLEELARRGVELAVADDAFQHRRMARDTDVVLIDATCPFGSGYLIPAGILREMPENLRRARIVVVTKAEQIDAPALAALHRRLSEYVSPDRIFDARLAVSDWATWDGASFSPLDGGARGRRMAVFSAIGNPASFIRSLKSEGVTIVAERHFRDHHRYTPVDMEELVAEAGRSGADFLACTEKDIHNLPPFWRSSVPLAVPRVATVPDEPDRFLDALVECLRPRLVVASNGYGEDAIGVLMAERLRDAFPAAEVLAFPLVGRGEPYKARGFTVASTPSVTPSGGVLKYRLRDLWGDIRAGLFGHIRSQQGAWRRIANTIRTPICVGDVYLLLHTLWGQGIVPLFVATAKTVHLSGHWRLERFIIRRYSRRTWTRDPDTAAQLVASKADAIYAGNPIMDLLGDIPVPDEVVCDPRATPRIMLLPGSRLRAYDDVKMLLEALEKLHARKPCECVMVLAPTIELPRLLQACEGWALEDDVNEGDRQVLPLHCGLDPFATEKRVANLRSDEAPADPVLFKGDIRIRIHRGDVATAAPGVTLLIGLGGTANQLCAGMGIPVVSIDEKGKRVQKKLLEDSEILVEPTAEALSDCAYKILTTPELHKKMSDAGRKRMGHRGALDDVVRHVGESLGWNVRCRVYERLKGGDCHESK